MLSVWVDILLIIVAIAVLWFIFYKIYMKNAVGFYNKSVLNLDKINVDSTAEYKLMKLYFNRQQTYEFSAYAILLVSFIFLGACVYVFIISNSIVIASGTERKTRDFWISLLSLRVGISVIVFFICQILLKLYRYCMKFAAFYIGLFDSLLVYRETGKSIKETVDLFMPNVDIGESPNSPSTEILQALAGLQKQR